MRPVGCFAPKLGVYGGRGAVFLRKGGREEITRPLDEICWGSPSPDFMVWFPLLARLVQETEARDRFGAQGGAF